MKEVLVRCRYLFITCHCLVTVIRTANCTILSSVLQPQLWVARMRFFRQFNLLQSSDLPINPSFYSRAPNKTSILSKADTKFNSNYSPKKITVKGYCEAKNKWEILATKIQKIHHYLCLQSKRKLKMFIIVERANAKRTRESQQSKLPNYTISVPELKQHAPNQSVAQQGTIQPTLWMANTDNNITLGIQCYQYCGAMVVEWPNMCAFYKVVGSHTTTQVFSRPL